MVPGRMIFIQDYIDPNILTQIKKTYSNLDKVDMWEGLISMTEIFERESKNLAKRLGVKFNIKEAENVKEYILIMKDEI